MLVVIIQFLGGQLKIKSRVQLRKSKKIKLVDELASTFGDIIRQISDSKFETGTADEYTIILIGGKPLFYYEGGEVIPTLRGALELELKTPAVVVDAGAVRYLANGADVMCPGIVRADPSIREGDLVIIKEESHGKSLAIGRALMPGEAMKAESGKAIKSINYVGDKLWNIDL
jgi:PUA-domain protein